MILVAKILSVTLALVVVSKTYLDFKKKKESMFMFLFWIIAWLAIVIIALLPSLFINISNRLGDDNSGIGTFLGIAFIFLFFVTYRIYAKAHRLERQLRDLVMKIGLKDLDK